MRFEIRRVSIMDIEGIDNDADATAFMRALSEATEGMAMLFQGRPVAYIKHIDTSATLTVDSSEEPTPSKEQVCDGEKTK